MKTAAKIILIAMLFAMGMIAIDLSAQKNFRPMPDNDRVYIGEGSVAVINILANDKDSNNDVLFVTAFKIGSKTYSITKGSSTSLTIPDTGILSIKSDGFVTFHPDKTFSGERRLRTIVYTVSDGKLTATSSLVISYYDNLWMDPADTTGYCMVHPGKNGGIVYLPLVRRIERGQWHYYFDMGSEALWPLDSFIWHYWFTQKIKKGDPVDFSTLKGY